MAKVKIVGNIIELNNPTDKMVHIAMNPVLDIEMVTINMAPMAKAANTLAGCRILVRYAPMNHPIIAPLQ